MTNIALFTTFPEWPLARQTPGSALRWGEAAFTLNPEGGRFDCCVVYDGLPRPIALECPPDRTFFIAGEPPSIKQYHPVFLRQFATVITCHSDTPHPRVRHVQQGYPWHIGVARSGGLPVAALDFDAMVRAGMPEKTKLLSVIVSDRAVTIGHRSRRAFAARLQAHFGPRIDVFGRGIRTLSDKAEGILPYRYHVALENSRFPDYWTEKVADAYLGGAHPFYWGCPNLDRYVPAGSFTTINVYDPEAAIAGIEQAMAEQRYERSRPLIAEARDLVLHKYNIFAALAELAATRSTMSPATVTLRPEGIFGDSLRKKLRLRLRRAVPRRFRRAPPPL